MASIEPDCFVTFYTDENCESIMSVVPEGVCVSGDGDDFGSFVYDYRNS